ncbi:hypothetical protein PILCRDRAFT_471474 [Piloderma croceum F 1598]|uniref:Uncharacterized protein n=1 Tax=Piloderma croceum (strain F 1598) TaxID=765440 RepID=A0A0C3FTN5_PILCF|nr:hypothetical protein PILCRDRAFT_471474 [Piloderma croceum F 1598]
MNRIELAYFVENFGGFLCRFLQKALFLYQILLPLPAQLPQSFQQRARLPSLREPSSSSSPSFVALQRRHAFLLSISRRFTACASSLRSSRVLCTNLHMH